MPLRILIADNSSDSSDLLSRLLSGCGFEFVVASNTEEFSEHVTTFVPDVVLVAEPTFNLEKQTIAILQDRYQRRELSAIITTSVHSHKTQMPDLGGCVRRLNNPWTSNELLGAIFEATYIGCCNTKAANRTEKSNIPRSSMKSEL